MFTRLSTWLDHRTGYHSLIKVLLIEHIPGGARWRYVWGSCLAFVFGVQLLTGVLLMTAYSPSASTAWSSVYFIQYEMDFGWLIRGLHHFGSQAMVVLLGVHMLQVVIAGAHLPPREVNWWLGLALLGCVLGLSLTGYLLPWDQKGYWATQVATNIAGNLPVLGPWLQKIIVGGPVYGHHTLTRFFTLHVAILPPLAIVLVVAHLTVFRRHGVTVRVRPPQPTSVSDEESTGKADQGDGWFWPDQAFRDMVASMVIFGILLALVLWGHGQKIESADPDAAPPSLYERIAHAGRDGLGANLDAPADPARPYPARPEWYFLFLFQLLKYFEGKQEIIGTVIIPMAAGLVLAVLPLLGYGRLRILGHVIGVVIIVSLLAAVATLTFLALANDLPRPGPRAVLLAIATRAVPVLALVLLVLLGLLALPLPNRLGKVVFVTGSVLLGFLGLAIAGLAYQAMKNDLPPALVASVENWLEPNETVAGAEKFHEEVEQADRLAKRAVQLASAGIPEEGAHLLLRRDPLTRGKELFGQHCATCHSHGQDFENPKPSAPDLADFGTQKWITGLLAEPDSPRYFGNTKLRTMSSWAKRTKARAKREGEESKLQADFDKIAGWLGSHPRQDPPTKEDTSPFAQGYRAFEERCLQCHTFKEQGGTDTKGPDFTGYGDAAWIRMMIMAPSHDLRYGPRNAMPAFRDLESPTEEVLTQLLTKESKEENAQAEEPKKETALTKPIHLSDIDRELIIRWLLRDYRVVFGGEPISAVPQEQNSFVPNDQERKSK